MPRYLPFAGKNAIAEMNIALQFSSPLDNKIGEAAEAIKAEFAADLPKFEPMQTLTISLGSFPIPAGTGTSSLTGFSLTKAKQDGTIARALRATNNIVSVHFLEYASWGETKAEAIEYFTRC